MILKLGIRNVLRNKRRSFLSGLAMGIGLLSLTLTDGFIEGMKVEMVNSLVKTFMGEAQIHRVGFRKTLEVENTINNIEEVLSNLKNEEEVAAFAPRTKSYSMISSAENYLNIMLVGMISQKEHLITKIKKSLTKGKLPENKNDILIGEKLAKKLKVDLGQKVVVTTVQDKTGDLSQELFRVCGLFSFNSRNMDNSFAYIPLSTSQKMLNIGHNVHEISIKFKKLKYAQNLKSPFWKKYSKDDNEALSYMQLAPEIQSMIKMMSYSTLSVGVIIFILVGLSIMNTLFMSLYERMYEFGMLRAIGTRSFLIIKLILTEASFLAFVSIIIGIIFSLIFGGYLAIYGINYSGTDIGETTISDPVHLIFHIKHFIFYPFIIFLFSLIAAIYPAIYASKITFRKAMDKL